MYTIHIVNNHQANPNNQIPIIKHNRFGKLVIGFWLLFGVWFLVIGVLPLYAQDAKEEEALFVAQKAFADGFYEVSLELLERFIKNYPTSPKIPEANLFIGECYFHQNKFLDALNKFNQLLNNPHRLDIQDAVFYWIAELHFKGNDFKTAAQFYTKLIDNFPKSVYTPSAYYSLAWCLFQERDFFSALSYFKMVEEKFPQHPTAQDASFKIVECLYNLKDYQELKKRIKSYLKAHSKDNIKLNYLYFYLAEADYYLGNFQNAIDTYSKVTLNTRDDKIFSLSKLGMGWAYLKLKQYQKAEDSFFLVKTEALEKTSKDILLLGRAALSFETQKFSEAKNIYHELINTASDPAVCLQAYLGKAEALYNTADYPKAVEVYQEALQKTNDSTPKELVDKLHYGLAWCFLKDGLFKEAIDEFQKIAKGTEDKIIKVAALCQIGDTYQDSGNYDKAIEAYDKILKDYPDSFYSDYIQYQLGLTLLKVSRYDGAIMAFQSLRNNFPNSKLLDDAYYALGLSYFQKEDYNSSKEIFQEFPQEFKDSNLKAQAMYMLGTCLYNLGRYLEAIEVFKNVIRMHNQDTELLQKAEYEIADCFYQLGNDTEAMNRFKALRAKYPDSKLTPEVIWWLGEYYYRHNDLVLARRYFSALIQDFPQSNLVASSFYTLGSTYEEESRHEEAVENFKKVMAKERSDLAGQAGIAIADIYVKEEKLDQALKTYQDVLKEYPNLANSVYPKLAEVYFKMDNYAEALNFYQKSLEIVPVREMAQIQFKIGELKQAQGESDEAVEEYL
ncbi:MAG: tetratricopeptide repeat protein, partial [Candidatus Omnitrophica bacterium]|nr:tetratricopeptide repeat protein [Candidatus Omnitrophota bacterium]